MSNRMNEYLIQQFVDEMQEPIFYFSLRRCSDPMDAEDLAADICAAVITALRRGITVRHLHAWVWSIARAQYRLWAIRRHKTAELFSSEDIGDLLLADDTLNAEEQIVHDETLVLLHQELAFIRADYREVVVAFYIEDRPVSDIAKRLSIPEGTVLSKLHRARKTIKEGMTMARTFGTRSYKPEDISFNQNWNPSTGPDGRHYIERLIPKNILLEAYDNPVTAEELSIALGVALPYMEDELARLCEGDLLLFDGKRYKTAIAILSADAQLAMKTTAERYADLLTPHVLQAIDEINSKEGLPQNQSMEDRRAALLEMYIGSNPRRMLSPMFTLKHKNGAEWAIMGFEACDYTPRSLSVWSSDQYHQIIMLGNRTDDTELSINAAAVPVFSKKTLDELMKTSKDETIHKLFLEYDDERAKIVLSDIPAYLHDIAMYETGVDLRYLIMMRAIDAGYIILPEDMNTSAIGIWNYCE